LIKALVASCTCSQTEMAATQSEALEVEWVWGRGIEDIHGNRGMTTKVKAHSVLYNISVQLLVKQSRWLFHMLHSFIVHHSLILIRG